ncbi:hypothetical protein THARTR1_10330 [Trichoderma harzianum]|uniref:BTB domain-containing protein n=1 Tax=Trichoderma harzianum TaxID=5544 RepID=A0A2K0TRN5_TRIHA|nr:hypothetical protein THARTR1_10330 [Trichoderma harzianum]
MTSAAGIYDDDLHIAHAVLLKTQQQFIIRTTFSWLPVLSLGRHLLTLPLFCTIILLQLAILAVVKNGLVQTMAKTKPTSLDGRSQKLSKPAWKPKDPAGPNLKPASPPKTNPWNRNPIPAASDHKDSSTKTQPLADEEFPELGTSGVAADTAASETAETRASPPLWRHPFGSNVYLYVEKSVFQLHRDILTRRSGWFRDRLPPPNQDGSPIEIHLPHAIGAVQPCLFFMYTKNLDICERDLSQPLNFIHIPRCVLAYCAAVNFQIPAMASRILSILQDTTKDVSKYLNAYYIYKEMDYKTSRSIATCFINSIDILYSEPLFELMKPMRHALAGLLDALLPSLLRQPYFPEILCMPSWKRWSAAIAADQVEYRTALGHYRLSTESILPSELELGALFDRVLGQYGLYQKNKASARTCYPEEHARRGTPDSLDGQDRASTGQCWKKREASIKEYSEEESTLVYQAPSVAGSTGSETGTWNSFGTDGAEADVAEAEAEAERPPTTSPRACHDRCMRSKSNAAAGGGQGMGGKKTKR